MLNNKKVSVILPTYNGLKYIKRAIDSVIFQSFLDWELLIVDDGSSDDIESIVKEYINKDNRIIYIKNKINLGLQKTLNKGLKEAKGKYIARIDDDDEWIDKDKLKKQVDFLDNNPDYVLVGTRAIYKDENGNEIRRYSSPETDEKIRNDLLSRNCFFHASVLFKRDTALYLGGYSEKEEFKHVEDHDFWLRMGMLGKFYILPVYAINYTIRDNNVTSRNLISLYKRAIELSIKYKNNYPNHLSALIRGYIRLLVYGYILGMPIYVLINKIKVKFFK